MSTVLCVVFALLTLLAVSLHKTYWQTPVKELKRAARAGDPFAAGLFKAASYGYSLRVVLWGLTGIFAAAFFLVAAKTWDAWVAMPLSVLLIWIGFYWVPNGQVTALGRRVAVGLAPALAWLLGYLHPLIDKLVAFVQRRRPVHFHTGLYEVNDFVELLQVQKQQADNRIDPVAIGMAERALLFGDKVVRDVLTPRRVVRSVTVSDSLGPILLDELHKSGFSRFPVHEADGDKIVGIVYLRDVRGGKATGHVGDIMHPGDVYYVHEEQPLSEALQVMVRLKRHLLIVVNSFEEYVGIVTIEDIIEQIVDGPIVDEFDKYDDMRAVAAKMAAKEHATHVKRQEQQE